MNSTINTTAQPLVVRRRCRRLTAESLQTISTVLDFFLCDINDVRLGQLYRESHRTARALIDWANERGELLTPEAAQFVREERLKQQLMEDVALRRNIPLSSD